MSTSESCRQVTRIAGEALTIYRMVKTASTGRVTHTDVAASGPVDGICMESGSATADNVPIAIPDGATCKVEAGGVIAAGGEVMTNAAGQAIAATIGLAIVGTHVGSAASASKVWSSARFASISR